MKFSNILYAFIAFCGLGLLASCEVNNEFYDQLDEKDGFQFVIDTSYTLTSDDYDAMGKESGQPGKYNNFSEDIVATEFLPSFLNDKYPTLDVPSTIKVTYDYYRGGIDYIKDYENLNYYQLTDADYDSMGTASGQPGKYNNFAYNVLPEDYLPDFLAGVYPNASSGFVVEVNFKYYSDYVTSIVSQYWAFNGTIWANAALDSRTLSTADYDSMGTAKDEPGEYNNFAYDVDPADFLPAFLLVEYPNAVANELVDLTYKFYTGTETLTVKEFYSFDGSSWSAYSADIEVPVGISKYALSVDDYAEMGFDEMFAKVDNKELLPIFLAQNKPYAQEGDKVAVTFKYLKSKVIKRSAAEFTLTEGIWVEYQSTIAKTDQYVRSTAGWVFDPSVLYTMGEEDYQMIVDYVKNNIEGDYINTYGTGESYYGVDAHYKEFAIADGKFDASFATWQDAVKAGVAVYLPLKFSSAVAQVDGVDVNYIITFAGYAGSMVDYTITFKCTKSGPSPEFEYVEGPTLK
ncbi:hypothetical protein [Labilibaculum euxinus]